MGHQNGELGQARIPIRYADYDGASRVVHALAQQLTERLGVSVQEIPMTEQSFSEADPNQPGLWLRRRERSFPIDALRLAGLSPRPEVQTALTDARATLHPDQRAERYDAVEAMICEEMSKVPLWARVDRWSYAVSEIGFPPDVQLDGTGALPMRKASAR